MKKWVCLLVCILLLPLTSTVNASTKETEDKPTVGSNLTIYSPSNKTYQPNEIITIDTAAVSMLGGNLIYNQTAYIDGTPYPLQTKPQQRYTWDPFFGYLTGTTTLPKLTEGQHNLTVWMWTYIGSNKARPATWGYCTVFFSIADKTPPNITLNTIQQDTLYNQTSIPLNFTVNEPTTWVTYSLDNGAQTTITENTTLTVSEGNHTIVLYANDTSGNVGQSTVVRFAVHAENQTGFIIILAGIAVGVVVGAVLLFKRKKRS